MRRIVSRGFTLIEMMIIAPIIILAIGAFIALIVNMTGEILSSRGANVLAYDVQDALNRIERDVKLSTTFLPENSISFSPSNPQGFGAHGSTTNFSNVGGASGTSLILATIASNGNPLVEGTGNIYLKDTPNDCSSPSLYKNNRPLIINIVYFIDNKGDSDPTNDTLWRRTVMPTNYTSTSDLCGGTPWQLPSCQPGYASSFCKTDDQKILEGIAVDNFAVSYFSAASTTTPNVTASNTAATVEQRNAALQSVQTVSVTLSSHKKIAGRDIERSGTLRATRLDINATAIADIVTPQVAGTTPSVTSRVVDGSDVIFEWAQLAGASSYSIDYRINNGSWVTGASSLPNSNRTYRVTAAYNGASVEARVRGQNADGQLSNYGSNSVNIPVWAPLLLVNNWRAYAAPYAVPSYTITSSGLVVLKGLAAAGTASTLATLPEKYRPGSGAIMFMNSSNQALGRLDINTAGLIIQQTGNNAWVSLDGISFLPGSSGFTDITTFSNGWRNYAPISGVGWPDAAYKVDASGRVYLRGLLGAGTTTSGTNMFTLPADVLPAQYQHIPEVQSGAASHIGLDAAASAVKAKGGSNGYLSINAVYFPTGRATGSTCTTQWCTLTLANSWVHYGGVYATPQYTRASDGMVHLKGLVKSGATGAMTANLPAAYCPKDRLIFTVVTNNVWGRVDMIPQAGGACRIETNSVNNTWVSLDSILYYPDATL